MVFAKKNWTSKILSITKPCLACRRENQPKMAKLLMISIDDLSRNSQAYFSFSLKQKPTLFLNNFRLSGSINKRFS